MTPTHNTLIGILCVIACNLCCTILAGLCMTEAAHAQKSSISIFIPYPEENYTSFYYKKKGVSNETVLQIVDAGIRKTLPCAEVMSAFDLRMLLRFTKDQRLLGVGSEDILENIGGALGADYIVGITFGNVGDEFHWSLTVSVINLHKSRVSARATEVAEGQAGYVINKLVDKVMAKIAEADICPWEGTIKVKTQTKLDTVITTVTKGELSTATLKETKQESRIENWDIEIKKRKAGGSSGKGSVSQKTASVLESENSESGNVPCFRNVGPCAIMDDRMPGTFGHNLSYRRYKTSGNRQFDGMKFGLTFQSDSAFVTLEGEPFAIGKGPTEEYEMAENTCGKCIKKDEKGETIGTGWGAWLFGGPAKRESNRFVGSQKIMLEGGETELKWDLHR